MAVQPVQDRSPSRLREFLFAAAANGAGTLLAAVIAFAWAKAAGFFEGVEIDWGAVLESTVIFILAGPGLGFALWYIGRFKRRHFP